MESNDLKTNVLESEDENKNINSNVELMYCSQLKRLKHALDKYYQSTQYIDKLNIGTILDDFFYLLQISDNDDKFEYIHQYLQPQRSICSIKECNALRRNYRNRNNTDKKQITSETDTINNAAMQIIDKIHCFFSHSYDIGNRLNAKTRLKIIESKSNDVNVKHHLFSEQSIKMQTILKTQIKQRQNMRQIIPNTVNKKYNQFTYDKANKNMYSFGIKFKYGYQGEYIHTDNEYPYVSVLPKHTSLKEELTSNCISVISIDQFNTEYKKSEIHFKTDYCKQSFPPRYIKDLQTTNNLWVFSSQYILAMMIYCNFTELQNQFTKTYRTHNGKHHKNFYWFGKNLKISVKKFGTKIEDGNVEDFYHGIGQQLLFPHFFGFVADGVRIHSPLSTSSSICVATNFTNNNNGLIIKFQGLYVDELQYFSASWLSDYTG
eukprot:425782_1